MIQRTSKFVHRALSAVAPALGLTLFAGTVFAAERPFTVDLMLQTEELGEVLFEPQGRRLVLEKIAAYETSQNFSWGATFDRERAALFDVSMDNGRLNAISKDDRDHLWFNSYSPSGAKAAIGWFDGDRAKAGVFDFTTRTLKKFDFLIANNICAFDCPLWLSEDEFIHFTLPADAQQERISYAYDEEQKSRWKQQTWKGTQASVKVYGSGAYRSTKVEERGGQLLKVDAATGKTTVLGDGLFYQLDLSPDRRRLLAARPMDRLDLADVALKAIGAQDQRVELAIYDFARGGQKILPCGDCNFVLRSAQWSPDGSRLFFVTRTIEAGEQRFTHYIYDFRRDKLQRFAPRNPALETVQDARRGMEITPFVWLNDEIPAIRVTTTSDDKKTGRHEWYALPRGKPAVPLTAGLKAVHESQPFEDYVTAHSGHLFMMVDAQLWRLSANGERRNLTEALGAPVSAWCSTAGYYRNAGFSQQCSGLRLVYRARPIGKETLAKGWMTLRMLKDVKDRMPTGEVVFLNAGTGEIKRVPPPYPDAEMVTAAALTQSVLFKRTGDDGDRLLLSTSGQPARELMHFNRQQAGIVGGLPVMLRRREAGESEDRIDWLLLPPGHKPGDRHPLLVYFYPDTKYTASWKPDSLRAVRYLNMNIPAAKGYAVLFASMIISSYEQGGDPMLEMHGQLVRAAENAVQQGYIDAQKWALMGHSYGGYGTNGVITQTNRFKAAVSMNGTSNLTSTYADGIGDGISGGVKWTEGGQGRMGVPPWQDPQRYIRNSPVFSADKITTPLLLIHGDSDDIVNAGQSGEMFNALQRQGKDVQFLRYWGEGHGYSSPANIRDIWQRVFAWLDKYLDVKERE